MGFQHRNFNGNPSPNQMRPHISDDRCLILSGLTEGERVVIRGGKNLKEGEAVRIAVK